MKVKKGDNLELTIEAMAFKGKGVAKIKRGDRMFTVFVTGTVVGDTVLAQVFKVKQRWAEAKLIKIIKPSTERIEARCKHFDTCGGCSFQNISYENQLKVKKQFIVDAFERIGGLKNPPIKDVISSPNRWFYRNKMELSFGETTERNFALGFHIPSRRYDIFQLDECFLQSEFLGPLVKDVTEFMKARNLRAIDSKGEGDLYTLTIREGKNTGERLVDLMTAPGPYDWIPDFTEFLKKFDVTSIYWSEKFVKKGHPTTITQNHLYGETVLHEKLNVNEREFHFSIEAQAFFQPNTFGAELLYSEVLKQANLKGEETVFDLFCGTGTIGIVLAPRAKKVIGVELHEGATKSAHFNASLNNIENIEFITGDVAKVLDDVKEIPDIVIIDPPRAGLMPKSVEHLLKFKPKKIVYVSCNPSTMARDCQLLTEETYKLDILQPVDMFPQSYHIENVATLSYNGEN